MNSEHSGIAAVCSHLEDHLTRIQADLRPVGNELFDLVLRGLHYMRHANGQMTQVVGPINEVSDAMDAAQDVIDYMTEHGYM